MRSTWRRRPSPAMITALLALFVALGGTGYAITQLPANSVGTKQLKRGAVTVKKIRRSAVTTPKVKDSSLLAKDFKPGQLPKRNSGATQMGSDAEAAIDPVASPDESSATATTRGRHFDFTLPSGGKVYIRFFIPVWSVNCSAGPAAQLGLYLDGAPLPNSAHSLPPTSALQARESVVIASLAAGDHALEARSDCSGGTITATTDNNVPDWTVILLG